QGGQADAAGRRQGHVRVDRAPRRADGVHAAHRARRRSRRLRHVVSRLLWRRRRIVDCRPEPMILVTGGAGFIGANFILDWLALGDEPVVNLDKLTYAGNPSNLAALAADPRYVFVHGDMGDRGLVARLLAQHRPRAVVNFAAETHVDRSIRGPAAFIDTNVAATFVLVDAIKEWWQGADAATRDAFRFLHVSTDEVYGSLAPHDPAFAETTAYAPNSPYSASKA